MEQVATADMAVMSLRLSVKCPHDSECVAEREARSYAEAP